MNTANLITHLNSETSSFVSIFEPSLGGFEIPVDTSADLFSVLNSTLRTFPNSSESYTAMPHCIYRVLGVEPFEVDGYRIAQTDRYALLVRAETYSSLRTLVNSIITLLGSGDYAVEADDLETYFDPDFSDEGAHTAELIVETTYTSSSNGVGPSGTLNATLPLLMVYPIGREADEMDEMLGVHQRVTNQYAFIIATQSNNVTTLVDEVQTALLGYQETAAHESLHYVSGSNLVGVKPVEIWREVYQNWYWIKET